MAETVGSETMVPTTLATTKVKASPDSRRGHQTPRRCAAIGPAWSASAPTGSCSRLRAALGGGRGGLGRSLPTHVSGDQGAAPEAAASVPVLDSVVGEEIGGGGRSPAGLLAHSREQAGPTSRSFRRSRPSSSREGWPRTLVRICDALRWSTNPTAGLAAQFGLGARGAAPLSSGAES